MSEYAIGHAACIALGGLVLACWFYMLGGRNGKYLRRYVGSAVLTITVALTANFMGNFSWWIVLIYPMKVLEFSMGYGVSGDTPQWIKRLKVTGVSVVSGLILVFVFGGQSALLLIPHAWLGAITTQFAFKNPIHAAAEEPLVCLCNNIMVGS